MLPQTGPAREAEQEARNTQSKAPFPDKEARGLAAIQIKAGRELGICLGRKRDFVTREGRFATELAPVGLKWIDPSSGRLSTLNNPPREGLAAMLRVIPSSPEWQPGAAGKLECLSKRLVPALNGVGQPTAADYKTLNLPQKTENEVWGPFIAAAARLVGDTTPQGARKFDDLVQLAFQAVPPLGKAMRSAQTTPSVTSAKTWPTKHRVVTSLFGEPRPNRPHDGVDIRARKGEPVFAVEDGVIDNINVSTSGANQLFILYHDGGYGGYAHIKAKGSVGDQVSSGDQVGTSDGSGGVRPHLHYSYRKPKSAPRVNALTTQLNGFSYTRPQTTPP